MPLFRTCYMHGFSSPPLILVRPSDCRNTVTKSTPLVSSNGMLSAGLLFNMLFKKILLGWGLFQSRRLMGPLIATIWMLTSTAPLNGRLDSMKGVSTGVTNTESKTSPPWL